MDTETKKPRLELLNGNFDEEKNSREIKDPEKEYKREIRERKQLKRDVEEKIMQFTTRGAHLFAAIESIAYHRPEFTCQGNR